MGENTRIRRRPTGLEMKRVVLSRKLEALKQKMIANRGASERPAFADTSVTANSLSTETVTLSICRTSRCLPFWGQSVQ